MPYNKGDFTEQGINGDVSALLRLNEKRVMKVVLSSDDESDNCDISGKVYDLLNGTSYDLGGTTPTGTIEITSNGTVDVAQYRYADINVSGEGKKLNVLQLVVTNNSGSQTSFGDFSITNLTRYTTTLSNGFINIDLPSEDIPDGDVAHVDCAARYEYDLTGNDYYYCFFEAPTLFDWANATFTNCYADDNVLEDCKVIICTDKTTDAMLNVSYIGE